MFLLGRMSASNVASCAWAIVVAADFLGVAVASAREMPGEGYGRMDCEMVRVVRGSQAWRLSMFGREIAALQTAVFARADKIAVNPVASSAGVPTPRWHQPQCRNFIIRQLFAEVKAHAK